MALVPSSSSDPAFAQQGSLDWVALANMSVNFPVAVLGRLSRAGLEPVTAVVAQGLFFHIPIGIHGQQVLKRAMAGLKAYSSFGDIVWFGVGIRHILRELTATSQGASGVAITAALSEGFSKDFAAAVLYELAKLMGSPVELTPSYAQWQNYVQACSSLFCSIKFGERINQLARIFGVQTIKSGIGAERRLQASGPRRVAEFLHGIGTIQTQKNESIEVRGGMTCLWGYVLCEVVLGLRVQICGDLRGGFGVAAENFDPASESCQVRFVVDTSVSTDAIVQTSRTYSLHAGGKFPKRLFKHEGVDLNWRIPLDCVLGSLYGDEFLLQLEKCVDDLGVMLACHALIRHHSPRSRLYLRYPSPVSLLNQFVYKVPDLRRSHLKAEAHISQMLQDWQDNHGEAWDVSRGKAVEAVSQRAEAEHKFVCESFLGGYVEAFDRVQAVPSTLPQTLNVAEAWYKSLELAALLCDAILDEPLDPKRDGLHNFFHTETVLVASPRKLLNNKEQPATFKPYIRLFSGEDLPDSPANMKLSAISAGGIYCYTHYMADPFQSVSSARQIHIGCGTISIDEGGRIYNEIRDQDPVELKPFHTKVLSHYPTRPSARAMVEEDIDLRVWFEQWDGDDFEERQAVNPADALRAGWYGSKGSWRGQYGTKSNPEKFSEDERRKWVAAYGSFVAP